MTLPGIIRTDDKRVCCTVVDAESAEDKGRHGSVTHADKETMLANGVPAVTLIVCNEARKVPCRVEARIQIQSNRPPAQGRISITTSEAGPMPR